jgi:hypothetical protein
VPVAGTEGQVLTKQSATDYDSDWKSQPAIGITATNVTIDKFIAGRFYYPGIVTSGTSAGAANFKRASPFYIPVSTSFDRIAVNVTTAGTASALVRLGIYNVVDGLPTTLVIDAGTVAADTTGVKEITIALTLAPGWYAMTYNRNEAAIAVRRSVSNINVGETNLATVAPNDGWQVSETFGAFPSSFGSAVYATQIAAIIGLRAS